MTIAVRRITVRYTIFYIYIYIFIRERREMGKEAIPSEYRPWSNNNINIPQNTLIVYIYIHLAH